MKSANFTPARYKSLLLFLSFLSFVSCHTLFQKKKSIPDNLSEYKSGSFYGIVNLHQKNQRYRFNGDIFISEEGRWRMDLSISPGLPVFTLLFDTKEVTLLFLRRKEFYKGPNINGVLPPLFSKMPGWDIFKEIFFERPIKRDNWTCKTNEKNQIKTCRNPLWAVQWERKKKKRFFSMGNKEFTFTFQYLSFSPKVDEKVFTISIPKNFKPVSLGK